MQTMWLLTVFLSRGQDDPPSSVLGEWETRLAVECIRPPAGTLPLKGRLPHFVFWVHQLWEGVLEPRHTPKLNYIRNPEKRTRWAVTILYPYSLLFLPRKTKAFEASIEKMPLWLTSNTAYPRRRKPSGEMGQRWLHLSSSLTWGIPECICFWDSLALVLSCLLTSTCHLQRQRQRTQQNCTEN